MLFSCIFNINLRPRLLLSCPLLFFSLFPLVKFSLRILSIILSSPCYITYAVNCFFFFTELIALSITYLCSPLFNSSLDQSRSYSLFDFIKRSLNCLFFLSPTRLIARSITSCLSHFINPSMNYTFSPPYLINRSTNYVCSLLY